MIIWDMIAKACIDIEGILAWNFVAEHSWQQSYHNQRADENLKKDS